MKDNSGFQSEYYTSFPEYMQKYDIKPEQIPYIAPNVMMYEEMMFGFIMFLLM